MESNKNNETSTLIWVFNGANNANGFPAAVFSSQEKAEAWIEKYGLSGTLTAYPLDEPVYDWAISKGYFKPKRDEHKTAKFIATFSSAYQEHVHYKAEED